MIDNIVLIVCDALRKNNLGCYGYPLDTSPHIDKFAYQSVIFENAWAVSNKTDPAFTSIETGLYPLNHGIIHHGGEVKKEELYKVYNLPTIAKVLKERNYHTRGYDFLGRWHKQGFDYYMGREKEGRISLIEGIRKIFNIQPGTWLQRLFEKTPIYNGLLKLLFSHQSPPYTVADKLVAKILLPLKQKQFTFIHFWDTHIPYWPPKRFIKPFNYAKLMGFKDLGLLDIRKKIHAPLRRFFFDCMMSQYKTINDVIAGYDGEIRFIDEAFGKLIERLDMNKTMLIFTSDHGESLVEDEIYFTHDGFSESVMRIPLIVWYPNCNHKRIYREVHSVDIAPTILKGFRCDGRDLLA